MSNSKKVLKEYAPSDPANIDKAVRAIENLGVRNPINPKEIVIDDSVIVEVSNWDKRLWFSSLYSIDRGQGNAERVMKKITDIADKYEVTIALDPLPFGTGTNRLNRDQLVKFYKKFGFEFEDGAEDFGDMERVAKTTVKESVITEAATKTILGVQFNVVPAQAGMKFQFKNVEQFRKSGISVNSLVAEITKMLDSKFGKGMFTFMPSGRDQTDPKVNGLEFRMSASQFFKNL